MASITVMDGITMGSGAFLGFNSKFSVATNETIWGVPECQIGYLPDLGSLYHLKRVPANMGRMLALTGYSCR